MPTAAQLMVKCLENEGVSVVFGIPGEENIRFIQALAASSIRYVLTRHEQGAAFMAEMYGRVHRPKRPRQDRSQRAVEGSAQRQASGGVGRPRCRTL